jgi:signal transduction histidine kinase
MPEAFNSDNQACNCFISGCWRSIRTHLIALLTLVVTVVYGAVAVIEITEELGQANIDLHHQVELLSEVQADALAVPVWNFDREEVQRQLEVLIVNRDIAMAEVLEPSGKIFAMATDEMAVDEHASSASDRHAHHHHPENDPSIRDHAPSLWSTLNGSVDDRLHLIETEIRSERGEPLGRLRLLVTHQQLADAQQAMVWSHFKQFCVITIVVALTIGIAVSGLVRPILDITETMETIAAGDLTIAIPATERRDEIGTMARALQVFKANAQQLQVTLDKERELNGLQRQFVSMVSHEFRTPLSVIDGNAQRMLRRMDRMTPERMTESLTKVRHSVVKLTELMESVLNAARLEEGRIAYTPMACSLAEVLEDLAGSYREIYGDRDFILSIDDLPAETMADGKLLRQVFSNLLSNACKYSGPGSHVWIEGRRDGLDGLAVSIRDEGVGIPPGEVKKLFERFFRASTSTGVAGTGIGLHLVQHFVGLHDGRIEVTSDVGKGTTFTVHLPLRRAQSEFVDEAA